MKVLVDDLNKIEIRARFSKLVFMTGLLLALTSDSQSAFLSVMIEKVDVS